MYTDNTVIFNNISADSDAFRLPDDTLLTAPIPFRFTSAPCQSFSERLSRDCNTVFDDFNSFVSSYKVNRSVLVASHNADISLPRMMCKAFQGKPPLCRGLRGSTAPLRGRFPREKRTLLLHRVHDSRHIRWCATTDHLLSRAH